APPDTDGWTITVPNPEDLSEGISTVQLRDRSLSTSGSNQKFFELNGRRYSHIIDPRTGHPATGMMQVTVTARTATESDALSTALFVMGPEGAADVIETTEGVAALFVTEREGHDRVVAIDWTDKFAPVGGQEDD
ncbi:MAG: FAD:protein FMN transferase, partial [Gemmatimonadota bacterium]